MTLALINERVRPVIPVAGCVSRARTLARSNADRWKRDIRRLLLERGSLPTEASIRARIDRKTERIQFGLALSEFESRAIARGWWNLLPSPVTIERGCPTFIGFADVEPPTELPVLWLDPARVKYRSLFVPGLLAGDDEFVRAHVMTWETIGVWMTYQALLDRPTSVDMAIVGDLLPADVRIAMIPPRRPAP